MALLTERFSTPDLKDLICAITKQKYRNDASVKYQNCILEGQEIDERYYT